MGRAVAPILLGTLAVGTLALASCNSSTESNGFEPDLAKMTVTISTSCNASGTTYTATDAANGFSGATATVATGLFCIKGDFFRPSGAREASLLAQDFELWVSTNPTSRVLSPPLHFESNAATPLQGIFSGMETGQTITLFIGLNHKTQGHLDFGPYGLTIQYPEPNPPGGGGGGGGGDNPF
jgi:hypothetical protein